jgi:hypothetical protein
MTIEGVHGAAAWLVWGLWSDRGCDMALEV